MGKRAEKMDSFLQREISALLRRADNPAISALCTVVRVECDDRLRFARVYLSVYAKDEQTRRETFKAAEDSAWYVRRELAGVLRTRGVPEIKFIEDMSAEYGDKINKILSGINDDR